MLLSLLTATSVFGEDDSGPTREQLDFFESQVRPLLVEHCYECHSVQSGESDGELLIDSAAGIRKGGSHGPALVPGKPQESLLLRVVSYEDAELQMPPDEKLSDEAIDVLRRWIEMGAPDPREALRRRSSPRLDRANRIPTRSRSDDSLGFQSAGTSNPGERTTSRVRSIRLTPLPKAGLQQRASPQSDRPCAKR